MGHHRRRRRRQHRHRQRIRSLCLTAVRESRGSRFRTSMGAAAGRTRPPAKAGRAGVLLRHPQTLPPPDPCDALQVHTPARSIQKTPDPPVAIAPILRRQHHHRPGQAILVIRRRWPVALGRADLPRLPGRPAAPIHPTLPSPVPPSPGVGRARSVSPEAS